MKVIIAKQINPFLYDDIEEDPSIVSTIINGEYDGDNEEGIDLTHNRDVLNFILSKISNNESSIKNGLYGEDEAIEFEGNEIKYISPSEVSNFFGVLLDTKKNDIIENFDCNELNKEKIFPGNWENEDSEHLLETFDEIFSYYEDASKRGNAMIIYEFQPE